MSRQQPTTGGGDGATGTPSSGADTGSPRLVPDGGDAVFDDLDDGDDLDGFDDFDDLDDDDADLDDGGGETGGGGDLEPRVKELEAQLDSISNSVETARIDTEELAESIDHIQDNIRQLLDIYEIVAKSANPFVDENEGGLQLGEAAFDLFGDLEEDFPEHDEEPPEEAEAEDDGDDDAEEGDGQTFDDLKAQYDEEDEDDADGEDEIDDPFEDAPDPEAAEADTDDSEEEEEAPDADEDDPDDETDEPDEDVAIDLGDDGSSDPFEDDEWDLDDLDEDVTDDAEPDAIEPTEEDGSVTDRGNDVAPGKPYLAELPEGYSTDVIVMEWLAFLVTAGDERGAIHAIQYYADLDWISDEVADDLGDRVRRADFAPRREAATRTLGTEDHTRSLAYINHLGGSPAAAVAGLGGGG